MFGYVFDYIGYRTGEQLRVSDGVPRARCWPSLLPAAIPDVLVQGMPMFGGAIMMILGALAVGSGYGWGTWKTVFTQGPGAAAAFGGTLVALAVVVAGTVLVTVGVDLGAVVADRRGRGAAGALARPGRPGPVVRRRPADLGMWTAAGVLVGMLARGPALAVGLGLVWALVVENLLRGVAAAAGAGWRRVTDLLPGTGRRLAGRRAGRGRRRAGRRARRAGRAVRAGRDRADRRLPGGLRGGRAAAGRAAATCSDRVATRPGRHRRGWSATPPRVAASTPPVRPGLTRSMSTPPASWPATVLSARRSTPSPRTAQAAMVM